ncbi:MAG TPA: hypothetical protein VGL15_02635 [Vicinamibacteria bacterium]
MNAGRAATAGAALAWTLLCLRWFDDAAPLRPGWLSSVPPLVLAIVTAALVTPFLWRFASALRAHEAGGARGGALLVTLLAVAFRLPLAWHGAAGYLTADGALSGIVALRARSGASHLVFVPHVAYSGSLKSHLTAALATVIDPARAFALVSVLFYAAFVAAVYRLALLACGERAEKARVALAAGLYLAFAPPFLTRYSLSNDGNYVEALAFGAWALVAAERWGAVPRSRLTVAGGIGLLLGLALWCHLLALIPAVTVAIALVFSDARAALRSAPVLAAGGVAGYLPGLLWNATHGWESVRYLWPGEIGTVGPPAKAAAMLREQWPVLAGYDPGYGGLADAALRVYAWCALLLFAVSVVAAAAGARRATPGLRLLLLLLGVNLAFAVLVLPDVPGNPRYLLFSMIALPVFVARLLAPGRGRIALAALIGFGAFGSLAQAPGAFEADRRWREFVASLEAEGVRHCFTDFYLATKIDFLSQERIVCSSKLGPTTTEYFFEYREQTERAPQAALVAVNPTAAEKLERRLERLGVTYERRDLMKPVLLRLSRKVDPAELFPGHSFPLR